MELNRGCGERNGLQTHCEIGQVGQNNRTKLMTFPVFPGAWSSLLCFYAIGFGLSFQQATNSLNNIVRKILKDSWESRGKRRLWKSLED